jgi:hypothetical protein
MIMSLQSSGSISLTNIQDEFGGSFPISISEYYSNNPINLYVQNNSAISRFI